MTTTSPARRSDHREVFERFARERDPRDRELLVQRYLPLARHLSRKYFAAGEREDLEQVAAVGLLKAIDRFDAGRGIAFSSFAVPTILGELKRYFRDLGWTVRVPHSLQELAKRVNNETDALARELGRIPTATELAERCESTVEEVLETRDLSTAHRAISIDASTNDEAITRSQAIGVEDAGYSRVEASIDVDRALIDLPERERTILRLCFEHDLTQREIAHQLGLSQMHVSRLLATTLEALSRRRAITGLVEHAG